MKQEAEANKGDMERQIAETLKMAMERELRIKAQDRETKEREHELRRGIEERVRERDEEDGREGPVRPQVLVAVRLEVDAARSRVVREPEHQHLRHEFSDLTGREVDHGHHLPSGKRIWFVVLGDLRRTFFLSNIVTEIDPQLDVF